MGKNALLLALLLAASVTSCSSGEKAEESVSSEVSITEDTAAEEESSKTEDYSSAAIGTWKLEKQSDEFESELVIVAKDKAYLKELIEVTDNFYFDKEHNLDFNGKVFTEDEYVFENGHFYLEYNGDVIMELEKIDDSDDLFGEYLLTGGKYRDKVMGALNEEDIQGIEIMDEKLFYTVSENKTLFSFHEEIDGFEMDENTMLTDISASGDLLESSYKVEGDTLYITNSEGVESTLTRVK